MTQQSTHREQDLLVQEILAGMLDSRIVGVTVGAPPEDFEQRGNRSWLVFRVAVRDDADYIRAYWQGTIVAGLFRELSPARGLPRLYGLSFVKVWPDGRTEDADAGIIDLEPQVSRELPAASLDGRIRAAGEKFGASIKSIKMSAPLGKLAPTISIQVQNPRAFMNSDGKYEIMRAVRGGGSDLPAAEGVLLEVRDAQNHLLTISGYSVRTGSGVGTVDRQYLPSGAWVADEPAGGWESLRSDNQD